MEDTWYEPFNDIKAGSFDNIVEENIVEKDKETNRDYDFVQQTLDTILKEFRSGQMRACNFIL